MATRLFSLLLLALVCSSSSPARPVASTADHTPAAPQARRPRLVVIIVIDQFRADYLDRFRGEFTGGFTRMLADGRLFASANYEQWPTVTAVGHATISTGATPAGHGIVGNAWYDRALGREITAVEDPESIPVPSGVFGVSPRRLLGSTIGDEMKLATRGASKVVAISLKDRSAILLGGHTPDAALWFDAATGQFVTSRYYGAALPAWAQRFDAGNPADRYFGKAWELALPASRYGASNLDDAEGEAGTTGRVFPHDPSAGSKAPDGPFYQRLEETPFANDLVADLARAAVEGEGLGKDDTPDLLAVSFSANDLIGHGYGPYSREVEDVTIRTDRMLGAFLDFLDSAVGKGQYTVALTADHGVAPNPADTARLGGRYATTEAIQAAAEASLVARFGAGPWILYAGGGTGSGVYLNRKLAAERKVELVTLETAAASAFAAGDGVHAVFTATDLAEGRVEAGDVVARRVGASYSPGRSPDLTVIFDPFIVLRRPGGGTTHGTPYSYDSHVPVLFYGAGVTRGQVDEAVAVRDIAPTIAALLGMTPPSGSSGHSLPLR